MDTGTIQRADPRARRQAIGIFCVATPVGLAAILTFEYFQADLRSWLESNIGLLADNTILVFTGSLVLVSPVLAFAIYLILLGQRSVRGQRFPPRGYAVVRDTPVLEGSKAIGRGRLLQVLSCALLFAAASIPVVIWYLFRFLVGVS